MPGNVNMPSSSKSLNYDVVFLHDATGSQQPYIDAARQYVLNTVSIIEKSVKKTGGDLRYRVVAFRDHKEQGDAWVIHDSNQFTKDPTALQRQLAALVASGGGDGPEAQIDALDAVLRSSWRQNVKKVVILITDSPPHGIGEPGDRIPKSHPDALTAKSILESFFLRDAHLTVVGCIPEINKYKKAVGFYTDFATKTGGKYITLTRDGKQMSRAMVGSVLHAVDSLRLDDKWGDWIMDQSHRGHDAIVRDLHSKLSAEGEECHDVYCTEHGGHDVKYDFGPVSRARVDAIVGKSLRYKELAESNDLASAILG
ncbi:hypothetical protein K438DRAFT_1806976 [Mycena galopus ATCC 62051]|nr:hypothetical protein K438DRAFT_1806976 [Mycena galopus ATCC 62051]